MRQCKHPDCASLVSPRQVYCSGTCRSSAPRNLTGRCSVCDGQLPPRARSYCGPWCYTFGQEIQALEKRVRTWRARVEEDQSQLEIAEADLERALLQRAKQRSAS